MMRAGQTLQLHLSRFAEGYVSTARRQLSQKRRHQYLATTRLTSDTRSEVHMLPEEVIAFLDHLAGVEAHAHRDRLIR